MTPKQSPERRPLVPWLAGKPPCRYEDEMLPMYEKDLPRLPEAPRVPWQGRLMASAPKDGPLLPIPGYRKRPTFWWGRWLILQE